MLLIKLLGTRMGKTLLNIKSIYSDLGKAEKKIADFLVENPQKILPYSITEVAEKCGCSEATIVRFSRKLGCSGYQQLKILIAQEESLKSNVEDVCRSDSAIDIFEKVTNDIYSSLQKTKNALNKEHLQACCKAILNANKIYVFGLGNSAPIALDCAHKFLRVGLPAFSCSDNHLQSIISSHTKPGDVIIGISHSGSSKDIVNSLKCAKDCGATTIAITNYGKSPIDKVCDYILHTVSDEVNHTILGLNSRIAQLAIIDTLYSYILCHSKTAKNCIKKTEKALEDKKF